MLEIVGNRIRKLRLEKGWSQLELSQEAGISLNSVGHIERAEKGVTFEVLTKVANALDISLSELCRLAEDLDHIRNPDVLLLIIDKLADRSLDIQQDILQMVEIYLQAIDRESLKHKM